MKEENRIGSLPSLEALAIVNNHGRPGRDVDSLVGNGSVSERLANPPSVRGLTNRTLPLETYLNQLSSSTLTPTTLMAIVLRDKGFCRLANYPMVVDALTQAFLTDKASLTIQEQTQQIKRS